jgi:catechol 2,3-dioxygenase-like lactoylglutathione lyase family enzyme
MLTGIGRATVLMEDLQAGLDWYREVLGFDVIYDNEVAGYRYLYIGVPGQAGMGLWLMQAGDEGSRGHVGNQTGGEPLLVLYTDDLDRVLAHLQAHGVEAWNVRGDADSRSLHFRDVAGNVLVVAELRT